MSLFSFFEVVASALNQGRLLFADLPRFPNFSLFSAHGHLIS